MKAADLEKIDRYHIPSEDAVSIVVVPFPYRIAETFGEVFDFQFGRLPFLKTRLLHARLRW